MREQGRAPGRGRRGREDATLTVDRLNEFLLLCALVLLVAVAAVRLTSRSGLPSLLLYLAIGVVLGQDGLGLDFHDPETTQVLGYAALVVILAEGGLSTRWRDIRPAVPAAAVLATAGVALSVGITAAGAHYLVGLEWRSALVMGAVVSSTDAAAVFSVLRRVPLPRRLSGLLEAESGFNDAPVVLLVVAFSDLGGGGGGPWSGGWAGGGHAWYVLVPLMALQLAIGLGVGLAVGRLGELALRRVALPASGLYPIAVVALTVLAYAAGALAGGSGFLATYVAGLVLGNARLPHRPVTRGFADALAWLAQIGLFVLLGLLVEPSDLLRDFWPAVLVGAVLTLVARPVSVAVCTTPFGQRWREQALLSWAGLRGAVPIVLAIIPVVAGVPDSDRIFHIVFVLVVVFTLAQGPTLPALARRLRLGGEAGAGVELDIESTPLERLGGFGHLLTCAVPRRSRMAGVEIAELRLPAGAAVMLVVRGGTGFVPAPSAVLREGDELLVVATEPVRDEVERRLLAVSRGGRLVGWLGGRGSTGVRRGARH
ncbi:potassium/proton antiporter [Streptomyces xiamenensis]